MEIIKYFYGAGFETKLESWNPVIGYKLLGLKQEPRISICGVLDTETNILKIGCARCSPKDQFIKKIGRKLAYDRALSNPMVTLTLTDGEVMSHVFFQEARHLEKRMLNANYFKF